MFCAPLCNKILNVRVTAALHMFVVTSAANVFFSPCVEIVLAPFLLLQALARGGLVVVTLFICVSFFLPAALLAACLPVCLSVCLSVYLSAPTRLTYHPIIICYYHIFIYLPVSIYIYPFIYIFIYTIHVLHIV